MKWGAPKGAPITSRLDMPTKLSDAYLRCLQNDPTLKEQRIADSACTGLRLRLRPGRAPQWEHAYKVDGMHRLTRHASRYGQMGPGCG